jgi:general secretion pathway protein N
MTGRAVSSRVGAHVAECGGTLEMDASGQAAGRKMKSRRWTILIAALGPFYAGAAVGQAPSPSGLGAGEPRNDAMPAEPVGPHLSDTDSQPSRDAPMTPVPPRRFNGNPLWAIQLESLRMTRERPLFSVSRRPPPPIIAASPKDTAPPPAAEPAASEKPQMTLVGVVHGADVDMGVFIDETDNSLIRLRVGQAIRGWMVDDVDLRATTLEKADQQVKLELPARNTETGASTPAVTPEVAASAPAGAAATVHGAPVGRFKRFATANRS